MSKINLFEPNNRQKKLNTLNDPLKKLFDLVDFELYREELERRFVRNLIQ